MTKNKDKLKVIGNYGKGYFSKNIYDADGLSPTLTTGNHGLGTAVMIKDKKVESSEEKSVFTELEKAMITEDGNIKRYLNSDKVDEFKENQMATLNYPNGYGHGKRVHNDSIALTTQQQPVVKVAQSTGEGSNLKIRKLTPKECMRLMGFEDSDYEAMRSIGMSDAAIYHMAGDSIIVTVLISIFSQLFEEDSHKHIVKDYIKKGIIENK